MKHRIIISLLIASCCVCCLFFSSCVLAKDINEKLIATAVILDKKEGDVVLYVEIANITPGGSGMNGGGGGGGGTEDKYYYVEARGKNITEARHNLDRKLRQELYISAIQVLFLTESFSNEHLVEYMYRVRADEEYRKKVITMILKEDPEKILEACHEKNESLGFNVNYLIEQLKDIGQSFIKRTVLIIERLSSRYTAFVLHCIGLEEDTNVLLGYSVIKDDKIVGFIPREESKALVYLWGDRVVFDYVETYDDKQFTIHVRRGKKEIKPSYKDGNIEFEVTCNFKAKVLYGDEKLPYDFEEEATAAVTKLLEKRLKNELESAIKRSQHEFDSDYFHFHTYFRIKYPVEYENMDWYKEFSKARMKVKVEVDLDTYEMLDYGAYKVR